MYNAEIGDRLLKLMEVADMVEGQSLTALIAACCSPADAEGGIRYLVKGVERHKMHLLSVNLVALGLFVF